MFIAIAIASCWIKTMDERQDGVLGEAVFKLAAEGEGIEE